MTAFTNVCRSAELLPLTLAPRHTASLPIVHHLEAEIRHAIPLFF